MKPCVRVFREIGRADELGSGVRNLFKYCKKFCGQDPELVEGDVFRFILPLTEQVTEQATEQATEQVERIQKVINYCKKPKSSSEIMQLLNLTHREHFRSTILLPLLQQGVLQPTIPEKLTSPKQKYYAVVNRKEA